MRPAYLALAGLALPPGDLVARADNMQLKAGAQRFEIGNYNLPDIHALGAALDLIERAGLANITRHVLDLGERLLSISTRWASEWSGRATARTDPTSWCSICPPRTGSDTWNTENVRVSPERGGIRVSFAMFNTAEEVDRLARIIGKGRTAKVGCVQSSKRKPLEAR